MNNLNSPKPAPTPKENPASFLETHFEEKEINDYDDDDEVIEAKKAYKSNQKITKNYQPKNRLKQNFELEAEENSEELNLLEKNMSKAKAKNQVRKSSIRLMKKDAAKPKVAAPPKISEEKTAIFRNMQMVKLQNHHTFSHANRENIDEKYQHGTASKGNEKADEFVSFLGYLRDASFKASQLISKKEEQQLSKILGETDHKK